MKIMPLILSLKDIKLNIEWNNYEFEDHTKYNQTSVHHIYCIWKCSESWIFSLCHQNKSSLDNVEKSVHNKVKIHIWSNC